MAWLDDRLRDHPKIVRTSNGAFRAWALALCYCSAHGTEGRLDEAVRALRIGPKIVEELVANALWDRDEDGLFVHDWQEHNDKRDERTALARARARERAKRHRDKVRSEGRHGKRNAEHRDGERDASRDQERDVPRGRAPAITRNDHDQEEPSLHPSEPREEPELTRNGNGDGWMDESNRITSQDLTSAIGREP